MKRTWSLVSAIAMLWTMIAAPAWAVHDWGTVSLNAGGSLNGQTVDANNYWIQVDPGEQINGTVKIHTHNNMGGGAVAPLGYTVTWGSRSSQPVQTHGWIGTGGQNYNIGINKTAPTTEGQYYIWISFRGEFNISQVMSGSNWTTSVQWNDGNDIGWDFDATQYQQARDHGQVLNPIKVSSGYQDGWMPANWVGVQVGDPPPAVPGPLAGMVGLVMLAGICGKRKFQNEGAGSCT